MIDELVSNRNISEIKYAISHEGHEIIDGKERYVVLTEYYYEFLLCKIRSYEKPLIDKINEVSEGKIL